MTQRELQAAVDFVSEKVTKKLIADSFPCVIHCGHCKHCFKGAQACFCKNAKAFYNKRVSPTVDYCSRGETDAEN